MLWALALATYIVIQAVPAAVLTAREPTWRIIVRAAIPGATAALAITAIAVPVLDLGGLPDSRRGEGRPSPVLAQIHDFTVDLSANNVVSAVIIESDPEVPTLVDFHDIPGYQQFAESPAALRNADNTLRVVALGQDGATRTATRAVDNLTWSAIDSFGGWTPGPATVTTDIATYTAFAVDAAGSLWYRTEDPVTKMFFGWRNLNTSNLTRDITATPTAGGVALVARITDGRYIRAQFHNGTLGAWTPVGGTDWKYRAAATAIPNDRVQVFATRADGSMTVQTETATGFDGQLQALPGVTATGAPAAITASSGITQLAVHGNDGYIYITESTAPGSSAYRPWVRLSDSRTGASYPATTDPTVIVRTNGATLYTFRDRDGVTYTYTSSTPAAGAQRRAAEEPPRTTYTGGPTHGDMPASR